MQRREVGRVAFSAVLAATFGKLPGGVAAETSRIARWRSAFPALDQQIGDHPLVYLDSAASTQRPIAVLDALIDFYRRDNANPGRALHTLARRAYERYERARSTLAEFINASSADEIAWVRGTTEGINLVATAWGRSQLRRGDEILLTVAEHASNLLPWRLAAQYTGAIVRFVDVDDEGRVSLDDFDRKLSGRTRIVAFSHVSNVVGYVNPAAEICRRAHAAGARVLVDAAQSAPHLPLDVQEIDCDFLAFSSHKMLGPMGIGVLWARRDVLEAMPPYQAGSNMAHEIDLDSERMENAARKFGAGTPNVSGPVGFAAAVKYLSSLGREAIENHEAALTAYGLETLLTVPGLRVLGPSSAPGRLPVFSFVLNDRAPQEILRRLDENGIAVRAGDLSALPLLKRLGVTSAARASCYLYTRTEDIDRLVDVLRDTGRGRRTRA
ncbi:MAG: aminotransferase class V-fold PLP-dependent enzyme [Steroidobacteraceae bacterium]